MQHAEIPTRLSPHWTTQFKLICLPNEKWKIVVFVQFICLQIVTRRRPHILFASPNCTYSRFIAGMQWQVSLISWIPEARLCKDQFLGARTEPCLHSWFIRRVPEIPQKVLSRPDAELWTIALADFISTSSLFILKSNLVACNVGDRVMMAIGLWRFGTSKLAYRQIMGVNLQTVITLSPS